MRTQTGCPVWNETRDASAWNAQTSRESSPGALTRGCSTQGKLRRSASGQASAGPVGWPASSGTGGGVSRLSSIAGLLRAAGDRVPAARVALQPRLVGDADDTIADMQAIPAT